MANVVLDGLGHQRWHQLLSVQSTRQEEMASSYARVGLVVY